MSKSKSPKKDGAPVFDADPEARKRAQQAQIRRFKKNKSFLDQYSYHIVFAVFFLVIGIFIFHSVWKTGPNVNTTDVNDQNYINERNSMGYSFTVGSISMFQSYKLLDAKYLINNQGSNKQQLYYCAQDSKDIIVPQTYNFYEFNPACLRSAIKQGNCSSSYSLATVSAINDRWCKNNNVSFPILSPQSPIVCDKAINNNCKGGYITRTLDYAKIYGLVQTSCYPYDPEVQSPEACQRATANCEKFKIADYCVSAQQDRMKQQIYNHGPIVVLIPVYRDFLIYKSGVYQVYAGNHKFSSGHAIKIIGWDVIDGKSCWLIENTWGSDWGNNGKGCILMNQDQLGIERSAIAPALNVEDIQKGDKADLSELDQENNADQTEDL